MQDLGIEVEWSFIPQKFNAEADALANIVLNYANEDEQNARATNVLEEASVVDVDDSNPTIYAQQELLPETLEEGAAGTFC